VQIRYLTAVVALGLCFGAGCRPTTSPPAQKQPVAETNKGVGANPIEAYRENRFNEAVKGLVFEDGRVTLDPREAPRIADGVASTTLDALIARGRDQIAHGQHVEAIGTFRDAVIHSPDQAAGYDGLGDALITKGRIEMSQAAFATALDRGADGFQTGYKMALNTQRLGDLEAYASALRGLIGEQPDNAELHGRLAIALYYQQNYEGAWTEVHTTESLGGIVPPQFRQLLSGQMAEQG